MTAAFINRRGLLRSGFAIAPASIATTAPAPLALAESPSIGGPVHVWKAPNCGCRSA